MTTTKRYRSLVREVLADLGGRAAIGEIRDALLERLSPDEARLLGLAALDDKIRKYLRDSHSGEELPWALSVGDTYVQRPLLTLDERRELIVSYMRRAGEMKAKAVCLANETFDLFGVWIDPEASVAL